MYTLYITETFFFLQKQSNSSDCGLFAIANAMAIFNGMKPEELLYDETTSGIMS